MNPSEHPTYDKIDSLWINVHLATMAQTTPYGAVENGALAVAGKQIAWIEDRFKIHSRDGKKFELYDIPADPSEANDLSAEHPDVVRRMAAELESWKASCRNSSTGHDLLPRDMSVPGLRSVRIKRIDPVGFTGPDSF